ncbi:hypothetical protein GCM10010521_07230 [Streptomyces rameus]|uniref:Uncharacterized protein n=1 Tax=Streptomyces rameus TaxID=68261 RepID=A0ABP6MQS3_9ACTN
MQEQARQQANDQFDHWLRQERRAVYAELLQDTDDLQYKLAELVSCRGEGTAEATTLEALLEFHTANVQLTRRSGPLATIAHPAVLTMYQTLVEQCVRLFRRLQGMRPPDLPWDEIAEQYQQYSVNNSRLIAAVAVDIQVGPANRRSMG